MTEEPKLMSLSEALEENLDIKEAFARADLILGCASALCRDRFPDDVAIDGDILLKTAHLIASQVPHTLVVPDDEE